MRTILLASPLGCGSLFSPFGPHWCLRSKAQPHRSGLVLAAVQCFDCNFLLAVGLCELCGASLHLPASREVASYIHWLLVFPGSCPVCLANFGWPVPSFGWNVCACCCQHPSVPDTLGAGACFKAEGCWSSQPSGVVAVRGVRHTRLISGRRQLSLAWWVPVFLPSPSSCHVGWRHFCLACSLPMLACLVLLGEHPPLGVRIPNWHCSSTGVSGQFFLWLGASVFSAFTIRLSALLFGFVPLALFLTVASVLGLDLAVVDRRSTTPLLVGPGVRVLWGFPSSQFSSSLVVAAGLSYYCLPCGAGLPGMVLLVTGLQGSQSCVPWVCP